MGNGNRGETSMLVKLNTNDNKSLMIDIPGELRSVIQGIHSALKEKHSKKHPAKESHAFVEMIKRDGELVCIEIQYNGKRFLEKQYPLLYEATGE